MTNTEWIDLFHLFPAEDHNQLVITLQNGTELVVETIFKFEPNFLVMRGRQGGSVDESRAFFVPYTQMLYLRIERIVKLKELYILFNEPVPSHLQREGATLGQEEEPSKPAAPAGNGPNRRAVIPEGGAGAVKSNLLERIRAARASSINSARQQSKGS